MRVIVTFEGLDRVISNLSTIEEKAPKNLETQVQSLARDTEQAWKQATPARSGRLQGGDRAEPEALSFTLENSVSYYKFVDDGHQTPAGWHTKHGYRPAKRRSHVEGREMTQAAIEFVEQNIEEYLAKFLDV